MASVVDEIYLRNTDVSEGRELPSRPQLRPRACGKFLFVGDEKLYVRGVTYGPFAPDEKGCEYHTPELVDADFKQMASRGINAVRTYTVPPRWLLDAAYRHGLWVMVGIPWEQHVTFLDDDSRARKIQEKVRTAIRSCKGHPAILCFTIGNEIPSSIVRWHGRKRIEQFLKKLYLAAKCEDPTALVTYVNFPSTEYLQLDFLDFVSFNVYLEKQDRLNSYLARLHNLAGNRPLLMAEIGLDSRRNGETLQASVLEWQISTVFSSGCAGVFVFSWTDEWYRGGFAIDDWDFGLTTRSRKPKASLDTVSRMFQDAPFAPTGDWPRISVIVCSYNGQRTIGQTLEALQKLAYPDFEVIVIDDGSRDATADIARLYSNVQLISVENGGLSRARNIGMQAATGEIVAYIDDDAYPDPHWLYYLAEAFRKSPHAAVGGPNIPPPGDGLLAECVANAPGGPVHVLTSDQEAEHIPGCNFAVRKQCLETIGGFDPAFCVAGDDVDACWRLQENGWTIGFHPSAVVWHHRRNSLKTYWKQQRGYGKAEALLEKKWPEKYNSAGHVAWAGRLYGNGIRLTIGRRWRVYSGTWGSALFQSIYEREPHKIEILAHMPEWYVLCLGLTILASFGLLWRPLLAVLPVAIVGLSVIIGQAAVSARKAVFSSGPELRMQRFLLYMLTAVLFFTQPIARLSGRLGHGLTPWRYHGRAPKAWPHSRPYSFWSEKWQPAETWLEKLEGLLSEYGYSVIRGGEFDPWDLHVCGGLGGAARVSIAVEEHGAGKQLLRWRHWPVWGKATWICATIFASFGAWAAIDHNFVICSILFTLSVLSIGWAWRDCAAAHGSLMHALDGLNREAR